VQVPLNLSDQEQAEHFMRELAYLTLPRRQATEQLELAARGNPWPLCVRAVLLDPGGSPFSYWEKCIRSTEYLHAIHIFHSQLNLQTEDRAVPLGQPVVMSLSALLTLYQLDLIDQIRKVFSLIIISRGTRSAISLALWSASNLPAPIARKLEDWINSNRDVVRVRTLAAEQMSDSDEVLVKVLGSGEGEAFLLARQLGYSLYSDELSIRAEAWKRDIRTFSTISLLRSFRERRFSRRDETVLLSQMIALNFRYIPFDAETLQIALGEAVCAENDPRSLAIENRLRTHAVIGPFLNQFSEQHVTWDSLMGVVRNWWPMLLGSTGIPDPLIERILHLVSFVGMQRLMPSLKAGFAAADISAEIYAWLLLETKADDFSRAWTIIKHCVESSYRRDEDILKFNNERIPDAMVRILRSRQLSPGDASAILSHVVRRLAYDEREAWKTRLRAVHRLAIE
jgi:predicted nucleic acid-binding protein